LDSFQIQKLRFLPLDVGANGSIDVMVCVSSGSACIDVRIVEEEWGSLRPSNGIKWNGYGLEVRRDMRSLVDMGRGRWRPGDGHGGYADNSYSNY
jgi:hypothetical protein